MDCFPGQPCWQNSNSSCEELVIVNKYYPPGCTPSLNISSSDVIYTGANLLKSAINNGDNLTLSLAKIDAVLLTLTSISGGTGISYNSITGVITNTAPDQVVTLTQGANITITGTYPNFTIASTGGGGSYTSSQGITLTGSNFTLGGTLTGGTLTLISSVQDNGLGIRMWDNTSHGGYLQVSSAFTIIQQNSNSDPNLCAVRVSPSSTTFEYPLNTVILSVDGAVKNLSIGGVGSYGSGMGVVFITNRTAAPSTNPVGGGILYTESGALKYRGSGGTITVIANA